MKPKRRSAPPAAAPQKAEVRPKKTAAAAPAKALASAPLKRKKKAPPKEEFYDDVAYDDDDFGDDYGDDGFDDGYSDGGGGKSLPSAKKKKKASAKKGKKSKKSSGGGLQDSIQGLGVFGWILCGCASALVAIGLTTLVGYSRFALLIALMALVTGSMVGGAVRFAAGNSQGWGPGLLAAFIGLGAIMGGKVGAFAVAGNIFLDDNTWSVEDELADATTDDAMIGGIADEVDEVDEVDEEWLEAGKITEAQMEAFYEEGDFDDFDEYDYSSDYLPEVWAEAKSRWDANSPDQKLALKKTTEEEIRKSYEAMGEVGEQLAEGIGILYPIGLAFFSLRSFGGLGFLITGVLSAFKLGAGILE